MKKTNNTNQPNRQRRDSANLKRGEVFSYYSARNNNPTTESKISRQPIGNEAESIGLTDINHWWKHLPTIVLTLVIVFCFGYELILSSHPNLIILKDNTSNDYLLKPAYIYQSAASKLFSKSIGNQNKLTINTGDIAASMQKMFPELGAVSITLPVLGHQPDVCIEPSTPSLVLTTPSSGSYLIDNEGVAIANVDSLRIPSKTEFASVTDNSGLKVSAGQEILSTSDINFIQFVTAQMKANSLNIKSMVIPAQSRELDVYFSNEQYFVKFNLDAASSLKEQVGTFLATREYLINSHSTEPTQYIDVRVPGRAYYK